MTKRAILSVFDKTGLIELGRDLTDRGWELIASGGTARALREAGLPVRDVGDVTGAPEMLGGRVKTLHPAILGGILARDTAGDRAELTDSGIDAFDQVVCNLYPFAATAATPGTSLEDVIEQIDIGGVTLLRAAAKNFDRVMVLCDPADYARALAALEDGAAAATMRRELAVKAFALTAAYDRAIHAYLGPTQSAWPEAAAEPPARLEVNLPLKQALRYGENPHQSAALYAPVNSPGPLGGRLIQGKELSYNNLLDLDAAWRAAESFVRPAAVIVKHLSPCGVAIGDNTAAAFRSALACDPVSAFGGVIALNRPVDEAFTSDPALSDLFIEAIIAPAFDDAARAWFAARKKNCRLVALGESVFERGPAIEWRTIRGGIVAQARDVGDPPEALWRVVSRRQPTAGEEHSMRFAWLVVAHVKSNAIVLAHHTATVGIGGGLTSRVDAVRLACTKAGERARGAVMASDAFFPFGDGIEEAAAAGVTAVVQPGGSVRDEEVIAAADRLGLAMVFTGARHFRH